MANNNLVELKTKLDAPSVKAKFESMLGKRAPQFITSISSVVQNNELLQKADVNSIIMGAAVAASMDLPLNASLGYSALVPFNTKGGGCVAQFQIMTKGWTELFLRSGQCQSLINEVVYEGQLVKKNKFTGEYVFDEDAKKSDKIIGYMAYFKLTNGYEKTEFMTVDEVKAHAQRFSQTYRRGAGIWKDSFDSMALKGLSVDTPIKTYNRGWIEMGDIEKGDIVFDGEGRLTQVIAVSEVKQIPCYKITFLNGQEVVCDEEHDWVIRHANRKEEQVNIKELYQRCQANERMVIETSAQGGFNMELPVDPYCLGYWLGNGNRHNSVVTCNSEDTEYVSNKFRMAGYDVNISKNSDNSDSLNISRLDKTTRKGGFKEALRELGVLNNKHIPEIYEMASFDQRVELINGLLDSDGHCSIRNNGTIRAVFSQEASKKNIVDSLYRLLCSIGEQPSMPRKVRGHGYGKYIESYKIDFCPMNKLFGVPRKRNKVRDRIMTNSWAIKSIEKVESVPTICIGVDSPSKTYLCTESQIKTHNTVLKKLLTKWAPKSIEIQRAAIFDQAVVEGSVEDIDSAKVTYADTPSSSKEKNVEVKVVDENVGVEDTSTVDYGDDAGFPITDTIFPEQS